MYQCNNCGSNLKFDIATQQLTCEYCGAHYDPYETDASTKYGSGAEESALYDVTVFTCPQCGGEIFSTENSAAEFCSFCGASTVLTSRLSREKRPDYIIPFQKTKEDCRKAYERLLRYAIFAPKELKDPDYIDSFRGIYMPYWSYHITQKGTFLLTAERSYHKGNYQYTDTYHLTGDIDADFNGFVYDASSTFSDDISERIAPYKVSELKPFTPAMLSGFYADTADVDSGIYRAGAIDLANDYSFRALSNSVEYKNLSVKRPSNDRISAALGTGCEQIHGAMLPVWFLSYRKGDRISYATVNGQTGKISADLPVDTHKYLLGSVLLAIPIYIFLNLNFTIVPRSTLFLSALLALVTAIIYTVELCEINRRERRTDDIGYLYRTQGLSGVTAKRPRESKKTSKGLRNIMKGKSVVLLIMISIFAYQLLALLLYLFLSLQYVILIAGVVVAAAIGIPMVQKLPMERNWPEFFCPFIAILLDLLILYFDPASDLYFYSGTLVSYIMSCISLYAIIRKYNILATRPLPQLNKRGGDTYAQSK